MITCDEPTTDTSTERVELATCSDVEVRELLLAADKYRSVAEAEELRVLGEFEARDLHRDDGAVSGQPWLAYNCDLKRSTAGSMVKDARKLRRHPLAMEACFEIGTARVREFIRHVSVRTEDSFSEHEQMLLEMIAEFTVDDITRFAIMWSRVTDEDGAEPPKEEPDLSMGTTGNGIFGRFALFGEDAALFNALINGEGDQIYRNEGDEHLPAGQRRANAMMNLMRKGAGADYHFTDPVKPAVTIHITLEELLARLNRTGQADPGAQPVGEHELRRLLCDANLHRFITGPTGAVLDFGRTQRIVTRQVRLALIARDRHCGFPGCERPPSMCHAHHVKHWEDGGPTDLPNLVLLCHQHHHRVHEDRFGCAHAPDGTIRFTRPDGTRLEPKPRPG